MAPSDQELNEQVARKLGYTFNGDRHPPNPKDYCNSIEAAWEIVEKCESIIIEHGLDMHTLERRWNCVINNSVAVSADTAPRAIVESFLKLP